MISFWFHIRQPRQFHWAVAAQSGKPIMRGGGQVIKRQTATIITGQGRRQLLDSTRCKVHYCGAPTCCYCSSIHSKGLGSSGCIGPSCSPGGQKEPLHFHHHLNSPWLWRHSSIKQGKLNLFEISLRFHFIFPFPQIFAPGLHKMLMFSPHAGGVTMLVNHFLTRLRNGE